jgi:hypothetical protein
VTVPQRHLRLVTVVAAGALALVPAAAPAQAGPDGLAVLRRMRSAYDGKWYPTLTFVQRTIVSRAGSTDTTTWYESVSGTRLRIDVGNPARGNGQLATPESTYAVRNGAVVRMLTPGNPFLPLIMGVYLKPVEETVRDLALFGFDASKATRGTYEGAPVTIVGASSPSDTTSAQFWVDDRNLVLRVMGAVKGAEGIDVHIGGYERVGQAWLGTRVRILIGGRTQTEEYSDWKTNVALSDDLFDATKWMTAPHWVPKTP